MTQHTLSGPAGQIRHPLGLPKGSIRALLALSVFGTLMGLLVLGRTPPEHVFWHLWMVNYAVLAYYFANRSQTAGQVAQEMPQPLRLPRGTVRWSLILMFVGSAIYLGQRWIAAPDKVWDDRAFFPMLSLAGFFVGRMLRALMHKQSATSPGPIAQKLLDAKALISLSTAAIVIATLLLQVELPAQIHLQRFAFVYIIFYFGSRN